MGFGSNRAASAPFLTTAIDEQTGAMFARNPWNTKLANKLHLPTWVAVKLAGLVTGGIFGSYGRLAAPQALISRQPLSSRTGAGLDPCCALQANITLEAGGSAELVILFGAAPNASQAQSLIARYRATNVDKVLDEVKRYWSETLGAVQVKTPDRAFDIMLNGWLSIRL